jgi:hypothetical protein
MAEIQANIKYGALKNLVQEMAKNYSVKVGLLANRGGSEEVSPNLDMAGLGAVQEFGARIKVTDKMRGYFAYAFGINLKKSTTEIVIPARSWLQKPIERSADLRKKIRQKAELTKDEISLAEEFISEYGESGILKELAYAVATSALEIIDEAFESSGFGEWQPNSTLTIREKGSAKPLIDEGRLRSAVTYDIEEV